jgi:hypothetical protein
MAVTGMEQEIRPTHLSMKLAAPDACSGYEYPFLIQEFAERMAFLVAALRDPALAAIVVCIFTLLYMGHRELVVEG